jgi:integrase
VPLNDDAIAQIDKIPREKKRPFPVTDVASRQLWDRLRLRSGIVDLTFHDLRYEAISRFFEMGLSIPEVALISGHKDARMLFRHTHLRAEDLVKKINREYPVHSRK